MITGGSVDRLVRLLTSPLTTELSGQARMPFRLAERGIHCEDRAATVFAGPLHVLLGLMPSSSPILHFDSRIVSRSREQALSTEHSLDGVNMELVQLGQFSARTPHLNQLLAPTMQP